MADPTAELVVGSLNWTTKANSECGVQLSLASTAPVVTDFVREFDRVFGAAEKLEEVKPAKLARQQRLSEVPAAGTPARHRCAGPAGTCCRGYGISPVTDLTVCRGLRQDSCAA